MKRLSVCIGLLMALVMAMSTSAGALNNSDLVYGPKTHPLGSSYETWVRRFGRFLAEPPVSKNPLVNPSCESIREKHGVLFLPVATSEGIVDNCEIPAHTPLLASPGGNFGILGLDADTRDGVKHAVRQGIRGIHDLKVKVDGHRIRRIGRFKTSAWTRIELGADNIFGAPRGHYQMFIEGWAVMVRGFTSGTHTISLGDVFLAADGSEQVGTIKFVLTVDHG